MPSWNKDHDFTVNQTLNPSLVATSDSKPRRACVPLTSLLQYLNRPALHPTVPVSRFKAGYTLLLFSDVFNVLLNAQHMHMVPDHFQVKAVLVQNKTLVLVLF